MCLPSTQSDEDSHHLIVKKKGGDTMRGVELLASVMTHNKTLLHIDIAENQVPTLPLTSHYTDGCSSQQASKVQFHIRDDYPTHTSTGTSPSLI
jgi:hypothetical protein